MSAGYDDNNWNNYANEVGSWNRGGGGGGGGGGMAPPPPPTPLIPGLRGRRGGGGGGMSSMGGYSVLMRGVPFRSSEDDIRKVSFPFCQTYLLYLILRNYANSVPNNFVSSTWLQFFHPLNPRGVNIIYDDSNRPSGTAKVYFSSQDDVTIAMGKV